METKNSMSYAGRSVAWYRIGEGPPLILLHGWGSSSRVMLPLAKHLAERRTCMLIDLPGFGESEPPDRPWSVDDYADLVEQFMEEQGIGSADLLVHSFGGRIALKLCARPFGRKRIGKVLITGGAGMKPRRSLHYYLRKYTAKTIRAPFSLLPGPQRDKALSWLRTTALWKALGSSDYSKLDGVMRETFVRTVSEHLEPCLGEIPHEVLLLWGADDDATPLYQGERMERGIAEAALVTMERSGHYAFLDRPKQFASIAQAFFEG